MQKIAPAPAANPGEGAEQASHWQLLDYRGSARLLGKSEPLRETEIAKYLAREGLAWLEKISGAYLLLLRSPAQEICLVRDPFGVEPCYLAWHEDHWLVSASINALAKQLPVQSVDRKGVLQVLCENWADQSRTVIAEIRRAWPGRITMLGPAGRLSFEELPATFTFIQHAFHETKPVTAKELAKLLEQSVKMHASDNEARIGVLVSGGLDSSAVASLLAKNHEARLVLFHAALADPAAHDEGLSQALANSLGVELQVVPIAATTAALAPPERAQAQDFYEPCFAIYRPLFARAQALGVTDIYLGDGGDDLFTLAPAPRPGLKMANLRRYAWSAGQRFKQKIPFPLWRILRPARREPWLNPQIAQEFDLKNEARFHYALATRAVAADPRKELLLRWFAFGGMAWHFEQQAEMAHEFGLRIHYPLIDQELAAFAIKAERQGAFGRKRSKVIFRRALLALLPAQIRNREKFQDYTNFDYTTARDVHGAKLAPYFRAERLAKLGLVDREMLARAVEHSLVSRDLVLAYRVLNLERWLERLGVNLI